MDNTTQDGQPIELFVFTQDTQSWLYTTAINAVTYNNQVYQPLPISHDTVEQTSDVFQNDLSIEFPLSTEFASQFITSLSDYITTVTYLRGQDNDYVAYWKGRVTSASVDDNVISLDCESVFTSIKRPGLRACYERSCRHALYSVKCGVQSALYRKEVNVIAVSSNKITVDASSTDGYYVSGIAESASGAKRFIVKQVGNEITVSSRFNDDITNQKLILFAGCDHAKETCINKFNNYDNYGGFPHIPGTNPFTSGRIA